MKALAASLLMLALAGCAGPGAQPAPKRVLSPGEHMEECMNKFNACQMDAWCAQQPVCQRENERRDPTQRSTLPQVDPKLPRVP